MFQVVARLLELISFLLKCPKWELAAVEKAMFQGLHGIFQFIFGLWTNTKCDLVDVKKDNFLWSQGPENLISAS